MQTYRTCKHQVARSTHSTGPKNDALKIEGKWFHYHGPPQFCKRVRARARALTYLKPTGREEVMVALMSKSDPRGTCLASNDCMHVVAPVSQRGPQKNPNLDFNLKNCSCYLTETHITPANDSDPFNAS